MSRFDRLRPTVTAIAVIVASQLLFLQVEFAPDTTYSAADKILHYRAGQSMASVAFGFAAVGIMARVLVGGEERVRHLSFYAFLVFGGGYLGAFVVAVGKEALDVGIGSVEALDILATLDGASTLLPPTVQMIAICTVLSWCERLSGRATDSGYGPVRLRR